ncbi:MAG: Lrp/AsnC family transcriptional regulator [Chitinispirillaceae bacterium]|nr:Lrp/AsnC family transcriptional regulator [Chitinispirillaceae bacterium]
MEEVERKLLNIIQHNFPLELYPFEIIAKQIGITEEECIEILKKLQDEGILREIKPVINWKSVGYMGVLLGITVEPEFVDKVAEAINNFDCVTHNYLRDNKRNLWCTLTYKDNQEKEKIISFIRSLQGVKDLKEFASEKTYKIGLLLDV